MADHQPPPIEILPVQIRENLTVQIAGIPHDLTREEAEKIARIVLALATQAGAAVVHTGARRVLAAKNR